MARINSILLKKPAKSRISVEINGQYPKITVDLLKLFLTSIRLIRAIKGYLSVSSLS